MIIEETDEIILSEENGRVFIEIKNNSFNLKKFDQMTRKYARLRISNFMALKKAVDKKSLEQIEIGSWIDSVELEISPDKMQALVTIYESQSYFQMVMLLR